LMAAVSFFRFFGDEESSVTSISSLQQEFRVLRKPVFCAVE
jgi:hypothetical protein